MFRLIVGVCIFLLVGIAIWQLGRAGSLAAKAWAAPVLIEYAFDRAEQSLKHEPPWPWADSYPLGKLEIPRLQQNRFILSQNNMRNLAFGPTLETHGANRIFFGHRDTHFNFLRHLKRSDKVRYKGIGAEAELWQVTKVAVVPADEIYIPTSNANPVILFITCFPFDAIVPNTRQRYVVWLETYNPYV